MSKNTKPIRLDAADAAVAYKNLESEFAAVDRATLRQITFDVPTAAVQAIASSVRIAKLREQVVTELPRWHIGYFDRLNEYALAAWYAHLMAQPPLSNEQIQAIVAQLAPIRQKMLVWAEPLAASGIFSASALAAVRAGSGVKDTAGDAVTLAQWYQSARDRIGGMTAVTAEDIAEASRLGTQVMSALGMRDGLDAGRTNEATLARLRAANVFDKANDEVRRAVSFLRWHEGDVDELVPSLHAQQGSGRRRADDGAPADGETPVATGAPTQPGTTPTSPKPPEQPAAPAAITGTPIGDGAEPFVKK